MDHVPPRALFPKPKPANLITVPCCIECNKEFSKDEEHFRNNISMIANFPNAREIWQATRRGYKRNPKMLTDIKARMIPVRAGKHVLAGLQFDRRRTDRVLIKIAKGLFFHHTGSSFPVETIVETLHAQQIGHIEDLIRGLPFRGRWGVTFSYLGGVANDDPGVGMWILNFYVSQVFIVSFGATP
ncbi:MAG: hypothetical protein DMG22_23290 [Acidobacteria bacterium]|nr:MAG: hypothetical protein DMG22_23290 [Acidobacteriota bacterium]